MKQMDRFAPGGQENKARAPVHHKTALQVVVFEQTLWNFCILTKIQYNLVVFNLNTCVCVSHSIGLVVVVSHERVKGSELHPSHTQLLGGVASKATDVCSHQRHPKKAELQHRYEGFAQNFTGNLSTLKTVCMGL